MSDGKGKKILSHTLQTHVHGHARRTEDQQQDSDLDDAGRVSGRSEDPRGVPEPGAQQVNGRDASRCHYRRPPVGLVDFNA